MTDSIKVAIGIAGQVVILLATIWMLLINWREKRMNKWMESDIPDDEWYECEM